MHKFWLITIIWVCNTPYLFGADVRIQRVCKSGPDNTIVFDTTTDACAQFIKYLVWARNGSFGSFFLVDSIGNRSVSSFIHRSAPGSAWNYFIETIDSCSPIYNNYSDTVFVDDKHPGVIVLDSASINPITNRPVLGWSSSKSIDFDYYILYSDSSNVNTIIGTFYRDTQLIDIRSYVNPLSRPIKYDISAVDSCGNPSPFFNAHITIQLRHLVDTCLKQVQLNWTPYVGWERIRAYYIYKQEFSGNFILLDSVLNSTLSYTDEIFLGDTYAYFIRVVKDTGIVVSSSSNSISFATRDRIEPTNSYLFAVDVIQPSEGELLLQIYNPNQEIRSYSILGSTTETGAFSFIKEIPANSFQRYYETKVNLTNRFFTIEAKNSCGDVFSLNQISKYTITNAEGNGMQNLLTWDSYFTWNSGVNYYRIYRGITNNNGVFEYSVIDSVSAFFNQYTDVKIPLEQGEAGVCYYVEAIQNAGDSNATIATTKSRKACIIGQTKVFVPNAFRPLGINKVFRPEGSFINYDLSKMKIFDRWGAMIWEATGIRNGWNGNDQSNTYCKTGIYIYQIDIISTDGKETILTGSVTLLD